MAQLFSLGGLALLSMSGRKQKKRKSMSQKPTKEVRKNNDGSYTEKVRNKDGSGHDRTYKYGSLSDKTISRKTYGKK